MASKIASRGSSAIFSLYKISTLSTKTPSHSSQIFLPTSVITTRFYSDAARTVKRDHKLAEDLENSLLLMRPAASPAVSNIQDISSLQRLEKCVNLCQLMGRIGSDPQLRGTEQHPVLLFSLATHTQYRDEIGNMQQKTFWHRLAVFKDGLRETCFKYCRKGQRIFITGEIQYNNVKDPETNYVRTVTSIVADDVVMLGGNNPGTT